MCGYEAAWVCGTSYRQGQIADTFRVVDEDNVLRCGPWLETFRGGLGRAEWRSLDHALGCGRVSLPRVSRKLASSGLCVALLQDEPISA
jgi:hypothetical protein